VKEGRREGVKEGRRKGVGAGFPRPAGFIALRAYSPCGVYPLGVKEIIND